MKYGPIFAATLRARANFPDFVVDRRLQTPGIHPTDNGSSVGAPVCVTPHSSNSKNWLPAPPPQ